MAQCNMLAESLMETYPPPGESVLRIPLILNTCSPLIVAFRLHSRKGVHCGAFWKMWTLMWSSSQEERSHASFVGFVLPQPHIGDYGQRCLSWATRQGMTVQTEKSSICLFTFCAVWRGDTGASYSCKEYLCRRRITRHLHEHTMQFADWHV